MILTTTETIPGREITAIVGIARGSTVRARNVGRDMISGLERILLVVRYQPIQNYKLLQESKPCNE